MIGNNYKFIFNHRIKLLVGGQIIIIIDIHSSTSHVVNIIIKQHNIVYLGIELLKQIVLFTFCLAAYIVTYLLTLLHII